MSKYTVSTEKAPAAIGPYSQAVKAGDMLFISGQLPIDASTGTIPEGIEGQTRQSLENVKAIVESEGATLKDVVKCTVFLKDMNTFVRMNQVYSEYFTEDFPARAAVEVARLPKDVAVEIEAVVYIK